MQDNVILSKKLTIIAQLSNYRRTYLNKLSGKSTYKGNLLLIFPNEVEKFNYKTKIISWSNNYFKFFQQIITEKNEIYLSNIRLSAGSGYNVWIYAMKDLADLLNIKIKIDYCD